MSEQPDESGPAFQQHGDDVRPNGPTFQGNPYAPTIHVAAPEETGDVEAYRRKYLTHEVSVKAIGALYILVAVLMVPIGLSVFISVLVDPASAGPMMTADSLSAAFTLFLGIVLIVAGLGLSHLTPWSRILAIVISAFGLLLLPVITFFSAYFLYLLLCKSGRVVFTRQYQQVIKQTPHVRFRATRVLWVVLWIVIGMISFAFAATLFGSETSLQPTSYETEDLITVRLPNE